MEFVFNVPFGEGLRAGMQIYRLSSTSRHFRITFLYIPFTLLLIAVLLLAVRTPGSLIAVKVLGGVVVLAAMVEFVFIPVMIILRVYLRRRAARRYSDENHVGFSDEGVAFVSPCAGAELLWPALLRAVETDEFLLFYLSCRSAISLPKRVVEESACLGELRELIERAMGDRATLQ